MTGLLPLAAEEAGVAYIDCHFSDQGPATRALPADRLILRFMLNKQHGHAFRIDTQKSHPVLMYTEETGAFSLLDYVDGSDVTVVTVQANGYAVYSRHVFAAGDGMLLLHGVQKFGYCAEERGLASSQNHHIDNEING